MCTYAPSLAAQHMLLSPEVTLNILISCWHDAQQAGWLGIIQSAPPALVLTPNLPQECVAQLRRTTRLRAECKPNTFGSERGRLARSVVVRRILVPVMSCCHCLRLGRWGWVAEGWVERVWVPEGWVECAQDTQWWGDLIKSHNADSVQDRVLMFYKL